MLTLPIVPLTKTGFAPFGQVIETKDAKAKLINDGFADRFDGLAGIDVAAEGGTVNISLFDGRLRPRPILIKLMERHPLGSQSWLPLDGQRFLIVVAPAGEQWALADVRVFVSDGRQGVNYARGVWHHPLLSLGEAPGRYVVVDRDGPGDNCEERPLPRVVELVI